MTLNPDQEVFIAVVNIGSQATLDALSDLGMIREYDGGYYSRCKGVKMSNEELSLYIGKILSKYSKKYMLDIEIPPEEDIDNG